jgi:beta-glucanase (GH16 family)
MIQSWNKFCFTEGYIEVNISLPGKPGVQGLWPGVWTMGNLARAGFGATNEGMWREFCFYFKLRERETTKD